MPPNSSRLSVEQNDNLFEVGFLDRNILEEATIQQIGDELEALILSTPNPKLLLDFENVEHLSSAALGTLITVSNKIRDPARGGQLRLANIRPQIYDVFRITKLNKLFQIHDSTEAAKKSFR